MTQLYDLEKSLNSTLDLVMAMIPRKAQPMLQCQAVHLWMFNGDTLTVMATAGVDETVSVGMSQRAGEGYVADMAEEGMAMTISDSEDERLQPRNREGGAPIGRQRWCL